MSDTVILAISAALNRDGVVTLGIKVRPGAQHTAIKGIMQDGTIKMDIAAPPEDGKANAELIDALAELFGVPKAHVELLAGQTSERKTIRVTR